MKILHSSDWHLGHSLFKRRRYAEFELFLRWFSDLIEANSIDVLLISGDIFDSSMPSNLAQQLYYQFLCRTAASCCRHVVIIAGNHDSPSFLNAPRELLKALNIHVVSSKAEDLADEVLLLDDKHGNPALIVCAVPYLRDRDLRTAEAGEKPEDKERKLLEGIREHYATVAALAEQKRNEIGTQLPIVAMGHLFTDGGKTIDGDGVRELYVGSLAHVSDTVFTDTFDYVALGHLHLPQKVKHCENIRYSGSPLAMSFAEAKQQKIVYQIQFQASGASIESIEVPQFQRLEQIKGDWNLIVSRIQELAATKTNILLEIVYQSDEIIGNLRERLESETADSQLEILSIKNDNAVRQALSQVHNNETLAELNLDDVFTRCLDAHKVPAEQRAQLRDAYREIINLHEQSDPQAE